MKARVGFTQLCLPSQAYVPLCTSDGRHSTEVCFDHGLPWYFTMPCQRQGRLFNMMARPMAGVRSLVSHPGKPSPRSSFCFTRSCTDTCPLLHETKTKAICNQSGLLRHSMHATDATFPTLPQQEPGTCHPFHPERRKKHPIQTKGTMSMTALPKAQPSLAAARALVSGRSG